MAKKRARKYSAAVHVHMGRDGRTYVRPTPSQRLELIAQILEDVDQRCMAVDGPVTATRDEITGNELRKIYQLATQRDYSL